MEQKMSEREMFWNYVAHVNNTMFPMQIIMPLVAIILLYFLFTKPSGQINIFIKLYLLFLYVGNGITTIILVPSSLKGSYVSGAIMAFIIGLLFATDLFAKKTEFKIHDIKKYPMFFLIVYAFILYPIIEWVSGHHYPRMPLYGVFICPSNIFTIALLTSAIPKVDKKVFVFVLIFALSAGIYGPIKNGVYGNIGVLGAAIYGILMLVKNWRMIGKFTNK